MSFERGQREGNKKTRVSCAWCLRHTANTRNLTAQSKNLLLAQKQIKSNFKIQSSQFTTITMGASDECCATQLIDGDGVFNVAGLDNFIKTANVANCGLSYAVVAIMGPQSSGEFFLLIQLTSFATYSLCYFNSLLFWFGTCLSWIYEFNRVFWVRFWFEFGFKLVILLKINTFARFWFNGIDVLWKRSSFLQFFFRYELEMLLSVSDFEVLVYYHSSAISLVMILCCVI